MKHNRRAFIAATAAGTLLSLLPGRLIGKIQMPGAPSSGGKHWRKKGKVIYGARPDEQGPLGGSSGYRDVFTGGTYLVKDLDSLIEALSLAKSGETVFIPGETELNLSALIYIERLVLEIPAGVTLAGDRGHNGSRGALLCSQALETRGMIRAGGPGVRISGLRIEGPNPHRHIEHHRRAFGKDGEGSSYYYRFPVSRGITTEFQDLEVDNCEISGFSHSGIWLKQGSGHRIHHNFIHKCQYQGLGYGIAHGAAASLIEYNLFDSNRHSIAGTGEKGCGYIARHNVELGVSLSHCFDMHGGRDRKDGTNMAGETIEIYNNTFHAPTYAIAIRGVPAERCEVYHNWFAAHAEAGKAVRAEKGTTVSDNLYGKGSGRAE